MDWSRFGLRERPFPNRPDPSAYYPATAHETALAELRSALTDEEGLALLLAEPGMGKTLLAHRLMEEFPTEIRCVYLTDSLFSSRAALLQAICYDLGLPYQSRNEQELRLQFIESCLRHFRDGGRTIVVIDEAHHLSSRHLEELRLLSNLEGRAGKAFQAILLAIPEFAQRLAQPDLALLRQRLIVKTRVDALSLEEAADYLKHRVRAVGGRPDKIFGEDVLDILTHAAHGVPRLLNQATHLAFMLSAANDANFLDAEAAVEAINRLGLDETPTGPALAEETEPLITAQSPMGVGSGIGPRTEPLFPPIQKTAVEVEAPVAMMGGGKPSSQVIAPKPGRPVLRPVPADIDESDDDSSEGGSSEPPVASERVGSPPPPTPPPYARPVAPPSSSGVTAIGDLPPTFVYEYAGDPLDDDPFGPRFSGPKRAC